MHQHRISKTLRRRQRHTETEVLGLPITATDTAAAAQLLDRITQVLEAF